MVNNMTTEMISEILSAMVRETLYGICINFWMMVLAMIWKWFIGVVKRFLQLLFPKRFAPEDVTEDKK